MNILQDNIINGKIIDQTALTFDDVLIVPNYSEVKRKDIDLSISISKRINLSIPLISSPMDTVTEADLAIILGNMGGLGIIHRNLSIEDQISEVRKAKKGTSIVGAAVGIGDDLENRVEELVRAGTDVLVLDSAHGFSKWVIEATKYIADKYKELTLISGNVATSAGAKALITAGATALRVGMGPGSICTTRIVAGIGIPQITAILETVSCAKNYNIPVISDGGIRFSGDITKALACGAEAVMIGSLFAGTKESPGKEVIKDGKKYKVYRGMGSLGAMKEGSAARYGQEYRKGQDKKLVPEGIEGMVEHKGSVTDLVSQLTGGLQTGMYYAGVQTVKELQEKTRLVKISQSSLIESHPHDIITK